MTDKSAKSPKRDPQKRIRLKLAGYKKDEVQPDMAVYAVDRAFKPLHTAKVDKDGDFDLPEKALKSAHLIVLGPHTEDLSELERENLLIYRASKFQEMVETREELAIAERIWNCWPFFQKCISGTVFRRYPYLLILDLSMQAFQQTYSLSQNPMPYPPYPYAGVSDRLLTVAERSIFPYKSEEICDGLVEVYRRRCCCPPWVFYDSRLPELVARLEDIVEKIPDVDWPPKPEPDPPPIRKLAFFKNGALDELALNARRDLNAIQTLSSMELVAYIQARPYLFCYCSSPTKVAQGFVNPHGKFNICWSEYQFPLPINCHDHYAFVVKQVINGTTVTIYDGVAANKWFHYTDDINLISYHPQAIGCGYEEFPGEAEGAFALLQDIGITGSYDLKTPDATGWDSVGRTNGLDYNDGLAKPAVSMMAAAGAWLDRNWGGTLPLRYHFSEEMRDIGAKYYRISVCSSNSNGTPTGSRTFLYAGVSWKKFEVDGFNFSVENVSLGPNTVNNENNLFLIPYHADENWLSGQYHGRLDTTDFDEGRHLLTLEVFNAAGERIRPNGAAGDGKDSAFTFRRWYQETGPTSEVPFAALTHMFWWDNRKAVADIVYLRKNNEELTEECQFIDGKKSTKFSAGYRAYHPEPMFHLNHSLWSRRGLGVTTKYLVSNESQNVGHPPAAPGISGSAKFDSMLDPPTMKKCTFSLNLHVNVKTFNGIGTLDYLDAWDQVSFALEIGGN